MGGGGQAAGFLTSLFPGTLWGGSLTASGLWKDSTWCGHFLFPNLCHSTGRAGLTTPLGPAVPAPASPPLHQHQHPHFPAPAPHVCRRCTFLCLRKSGASRFGQMHAGPVSARRLPGQEWRKLRTETKACGLPPPTRREHIQQQDTPPRPPPAGCPCLPLRASVGRLLPPSGAGPRSWSREVGGVPLQFRLPGGEMASAVIWGSRPVQPDA